MQEPGEPVPSGEREQVKASRHLHSLEAFLAHRTHACGFASESCALVSHAATLLRGFGIPSVGGLDGLSVLTHEGDILAEVDFVSIGTNDILQYFMAADRDNECVIHYNDAASPAFLRLLELITGQDRTLGREADVTVCGEMASDVRVLPHLLRMGYRSFSVAPVSATLLRSVCGEFCMNPGNEEQHP